MASKIASDYTFFKCTSVLISMIFGAALLITSSSILRSDSLQIDFYLERLLRTRDSSRFPIDTFGSCIVTLCYGVFQLVTCLMYFFRDVSWRKWTWMNFSLFLVYGLCLAILDHDQQLRHFYEYYITLVSNCTYSFLFIFLGVFLM